MTPPEAPEKHTGNSPPAALLRAGIRTLTRRADFVAASRAKRHPTPTMIVQMRPRADGMDHVGVGFTCSKKVGNAVARNRAKRRLRAVAQAVLPVKGQPGRDYVLIGRAGTTVSAPFADLVRDFETALERLGGPR